MIRSPWLTVAVTAAAAGLWSCSRSASQDAPRAPTASHRASTALATAPAMASIQAPDLALVHARVIDGTGAPANDDQTVLLAGDRIHSIGPSASTPVPPGVRVMDLSGHTLLPGFVQLHEHTYFGGVNQAVQMHHTAPLLFLGYGVTTAMTAGSQLPYHELAMKQAIDAGERPGPTFLICGPYIDGTTALPFPRSVSTPDEARRVIAYWAEEGATCVKLLGRVSREILRASVEAAHARGLLVNGHLCAVTFTEAAALGIDALQHGFLMNTDYVANKPLDVCPRPYLETYEEVDIDSPEVRKSIATIAAHGTAVISTLSVYETFVEGRSFLDPRALELLEPRMRAAIEARHADPEAWDLRLSQGLFARMMAWERAFVRAGGLLASGSDPWESGLLPGVGNLRNYEIFVEAGFSPETAVQIMTLNGARVLGLDQRIGSIEPGKVADLVVVRGDPVATPARMYDVVTVFKDGVIHDAAELRAQARGRVGLD